MANGLIKLLETPRKIVTAATLASAILLGGYNTSTQATYAQTPQSQDEYTPITQLNSYEDLANTNWEITNLTRYYPNTRGGPRGKAKDDPTNNQIYPFKHQSFVFEKNPNNLLNVLHFITTINNSEEKPQQHYDTFQIIHTRKNKEKELAIKYNFSDKTSCIFDLSSGPRPQTGYITLENGILKLNFKTSPNSQRGLYFEAIQTKNNPLEKMPQTLPYNSKLRSKIYKERRQERKKQLEEHPKKK